MLRRELLALLSGAAMGQERDAASVLIEVRSGRRIAVQSAAVAERFHAPPGSTLKPFVLAALLRRGKLTAAESLACPGRLTIDGRNFNCSHPRLDTPMRVETALAYSCNYFVATMADRFAPGELAGALGQAGFGDAAGGNRLLALGEEGIVITAERLAKAYRGLALLADRAEMRPVVAGMEGAVAYGTAQRAAVAGVKVAGKTGSVLARSGAHIAWFAGFMPSRAPEAVVAVMLQGRSGGSDAAPVAGRILGQWAGRV